MPAPAPAYRCHWRSASVLAAQVPGGPKPLWRTCCYRGEFIRCQSDHDNYTCSHGEVVVSDSDGICPST
jgi:hypothetical protein